MTKEDIKLSIKRVFTDRPFLVLIAALVMTGLVFCLVTGLGLQIRDVQVYSRYTSFGEAHFYKSPWQYLALFPVFGIIVTGLHVAIMVKLHNLERRQSAILVGFAGITLLFIALFYASFVMRLAFR
jgi:Mn2+/Fe2+ NRAMP family transporter